ncbi:MAG: hypothetical protein WAT16_03845 [Saprospiraceae bacterium]
MSMLNHIFFYFCTSNPRLMLIDIMKTMATGHQIGWLTNGKLLNPYQKKVLDEAGISTRKWTELLFSEDNLLFTDLIKVCDIVGINVENVAEHYK